MANPNGFGGGFNVAFGGTGNAQLCLVTGSHPTYSDGDILCAFNKRRIRHVHAENICHVKHQGFNGDGLRDADSLPKIFKENCCQYLFQRISATEVRRTNLSTLAEDVFSATPSLVDGKLQHMNVQVFIDRRKQHHRHAIFGSEGSEFWYGGREDANWAALQTVWQEIEARTAYLEVNHTLWPATAKELSKFLFVSTEDFDDATSGDLTSPLLDETDPENPVTVSKRKHDIAWRNLRDVIEADVLDVTKLIDIRDRKHVRSEIVNVKSV